MFGLLPNIGPWELAGILAVVLIIFGPGKLPEAVRSFRKSFDEFRNTVTETPADRENAGGETEVNGEKGKQ